jgi:Phosphotransferase enzyme family
VDQPSDLLWTQTTWLEKASSWIENELRRQGIQRMGPIEQLHIRPWSTVLRIPTNLGHIYFKAVVSELAYESALTQTLSHRYPHCITHVLAANREHGWLLMSDGGSQLRERLKTEDDIQHWQVVLPIYAEMQKKSVPHLDELLELGLPDRRLAILPTKFQELLTNTEALALNRPGGLNAVEYQQLQDRVDLCARLCEQLAAFGVPETLDHGDLHDGNVFIREGQYLLFDWGDSSAAHPFFTIRNAYESLERRFGLEKSSSWFQRLRDCYLALWTEYETREKLEEAFVLAQHLSPIASALRWLPVLANMDEATRNKYIEAIPNLLREFLYRVEAHENKL